MSKDANWQDLPKAEFGFPGPLRNALVEAILTGRKTATTSLLAQYQLSGEPIESVGDRSVLVDSHEQPLAILETTQIKVVSLSSVDLRHAIDEGEGDKTIESWRIKHTAFWQCPEMRSKLRDPEFAVDDDTEVVLERFLVVSRIHTNS
ncbi:hypothetical protein KIMH_10630 [Bombiscardovia apis]|uniref:ASCH domain-containing protein n=1 Tax=Bombiscardovia apis TaxID=2932182 RepID=A0ABN6SI30_9BIFI|nr:ASCH domain-containing protein [Bombiscardovia apis]BDR54952.1 hypothetical protein KIMH_10630 [Bombiscardovia apis]